MSMMSMIQQAIRPLKNRIMMSIARGIVNSIDDDDGMQRAKATFLAGEIRDALEVVQNFGFTSNPPDGSELVAVFVGGNREHGLIVGTNDRATRITGLAKGESAQYNLNGDKWHLKADGTLEGIVGADWTVTVGGNFKPTIAGNFDAVFQKLSLSNGSAELVDLIVQTLDALIAEPFIVNKATFTQIKTKVEAFKI